MITRALDIKLNVRPVCIMLEHQFYYEGPCRFAAGDGLQPEFDKLFALDEKNRFIEDARNNLPDFVTMVDPLIIECFDDWVIDKATLDRIDEGLENVDAFLILGGIARTGLVVEIAQRTRKPIFHYSEPVYPLIIAGAALNARGLENYACLSWEEMSVQMRALRTRKALKKSSMLLAVRFNSDMSKASEDTFISLNQVTEKFGTTFRFLNIHELLDYMEPLPEGGNHTTPGRTNTPNVTEADIKAAEELADALTAGAHETLIERLHLIKSCLAYVEVKKLLDIHGCSGFAAPCPDVCSTRRMNEQQFTFCLTHSLLNEQGIPSACEYDIDSMLTMFIMSSMTGEPTYMGNTRPLFTEGGRIIPTVKVKAEAMEGIEDVSNLYTTDHSTVMRSFRRDGEQDYSIRHFAYDQGFGAVLRYDFNKDRGQVITLCRISPDCSKLFVGKGTIIAGDGHDRDNCNGVMVYRVADQRKFFDAQLQVGNHLCVVYGDYTRELDVLGRTLGLEVLNV